MEPDLILAIGIVVGVIAFPMIITGLREGVAPKFALVLTLVAVALITTAFLMKPGGYSLEEVPGAAIGAVRRLF